MASSGRFLVFFYLFFLAPTVFAGASVQLSVNPRVVGVGEVFQVTVRIQSESSSVAQPPQAPPLARAQYISSRQGVAANRQTIEDKNGNLSFQSVITSTYTFDYVAKKKGQIKIPPIPVKVDGRQMKTSFGLITVVSTPQSPKTQQRRGSPFGNDPFKDPFFDAFKQQSQQMQKQFNKILQRQFGRGGTPGFQAIPPGSEKDAFFIVAEVDKTEAYEGEQVRAVWYLYSKAPVREIDTLKYPDLKGFWKEDIELATLLRYNRAELNGQTYNRAMLASYALFPIEAGKAVIDSYQAKLAIIGGYGRLVKGTKSSKPIPLLIKELPEEGRPKTFAGAVGSYQISAEVEQPEGIVSHQPFVLNVVFEGTGNAKQFDLPDLGLPDTVEVYDVKKDSKFFKNGRSYKQFEISLIPKNEGELVIPPIVASYFNPETEKYEETSSKEIRLKILKGSGPVALEAQRIEKENVTQKLVPLSTWEASNEARGSALIWLIVFIFVSMGLTGYAVKALDIFAKEPSFKELVQKRQTRAWALCKKEDWRSLGIEVTNLVYFVLGDISGQGGADVQLSKLLAKCPPSVRREVGGELQKVVNHFYVLGFGPDKAVEAQVKGLDTSAQLKEMEKLLAKVIELTKASEA